MTTQERNGVALNMDAAREIAFPSAGLEEDEDQGDAPQLSTRFSGADVFFLSPMEKHMRFWLIIKRKS